MKRNTAKSRAAKALLQVRKKYGIFGRPFTEEDFYRIVKGEDINLLTPEKHPDCEMLEFDFIRGYYCRVPKHDFRMIYLQSMFVGPFDLAVAYHELGHHFLTHHGNSFAKLAEPKAANSSSYKQNEADADEFAALALAEVPNA